MLLLISTQGAVKTKQIKEASEQGRVKRDIYMEYAKACNIGAVIVYLVMLMGAQTAQIGESLRLPCASTRRCSAPFTGMRAR